MAEKLLDPNKLPIARNKLLRFTGMLARYGGLHHLEDFFYDGRDQENWHIALDFQSYCTLITQRNIKYKMREIGMHYRERSRAEQRATPKTIEGYGPDDDVRYWPLSEEETRKISRKTD